MESLHELNDFFSRLKAVVEEYDRSFGDLGYSIDKQGKMRRYGSKVEDPMQLLEFQIHVDRTALMEVLYHKILALNKEKADGN